MSGYGRIRSENDLPDQNFCRTKISVTGQCWVFCGEFPPIAHLSFIPHRNLKGDDPCNYS